LKEMDRAQATATWGRVVEATLAAPRYRNRVRRLAGERKRWAPALAKAFVARAYAEMRRRPREAAQCARLAGKVAVEVGDADGRVASLRALAQACLVQGRFGPALKVLDAAMEAAGPEPDDACLAAVDVLRLQPLIHMGRYDDAQAAGRRCLEAFERCGDLAGRIRAHMALADIAFRMDRPRDALRHYSRVDGLLPAEAPTRFRAALAANRANALEACSRFRAAARHFERARGLFAAEGCEHTVAQVDYNAAYADALRGRYETALRRYAATEETFRRLRDERHLALLDLDRAEIHVRMGMAEEARELAERAEQSFLKLGMQKECAQAALLGGRAAELRGDLTEADGCLRRAQDRFAALGLDERLSSCLVQRGGVALRQGDAEAARRLAQDAAAYLQGDAAPLAGASIELLHARLDLMDGHTADALRRADEVLGQCRRVHAPWVRIEAQRLLGKAHAARDELDDAILALEQAIGELERYRGGVPPDEYMAAFLAGRSELYADMVDLLVRAGHTERAFEFTERAKSRALVDLLAGRLEAARGPARGSLAGGRVRHLRERLNAVYQRLFRDPSGADARRQAGELEREMARLMREARLEDPEASSLQAADAPDLAAVRRDLGPGEVLLEYLLTEHNLFTFLVTPEDFRVVRQGVGAGELRRLVQRFRFHLSDFERGGGESSAGDLALRATRANLQKLAGHLLAPVAAHLLGRRLVVAPHGVLHHLPFHALPWGDGWVADRFEVVYAPSAAVYGFCRRAASRGERDIVFGVPDRSAPQIAREATRVAAELKTEHLYVDAEATAARLREEAARARIVHVATHGMFRREQPMLSSLRLADTWVNLYDVYALELDADLVVLSTCESGTADITGGDEVLGLTRGFLYAGARALITSQWRVHDAATTELMVSFYRRLREQGDAAVALKGAMAELRRQRPHPYYWAPFFLTGRPVRSAQGPSTPVQQEQAKSGSRA